MSNSCEGNSPFLLHSDATFGSERCPHGPVRRRDQRGARETILPLTPTAPKCARYFLVKSAVDRVITALLMVVALPLMVVIGVAIVLFDGWPVLYRQTRVGRHGHVFRLWKFRTMCRDAESETGVVWSSDSDPRVTALGRWLRCSHLDELPQFINVLVGDMNLIGPRPERPEFVRELVVELPRYAERLGVRPGITGLAQLRFGYDQSLSDVKRKALLDSQYVRIANVFLDAQILLFTIPCVARQVFRKWRTGQRTTTSAGSHGPFVSPAKSVVHRDRRRTPAMTHEYTPHIIHGPDVAGDFRPGSTDPGPGLSTSPAAESVPA
jgi:lipopolysaccharide/colanic/teichoic acid biosynthesis glycosyltransferase